MRLIIPFVAIVIASCGSATNNDTEVVANEEKEPSVVKEVVEKGPAATIKEQLSGFYDEEQETTIVKEVKVNDSINYAISQTNDGICNTSYLHLLQGEKSLNFVEIAKECDHDASIPFYSSFSYLNAGEDTFIVTEYISYVPKDSLDDIGEMNKSFKEYDLILDTLIKKLVINENGTLETILVKGFSTYKRPSFEKEDHEEDYNTVYLVVADTSADYRALNRKMYSIQDAFGIAIDTLGRYFNETTKKLVLPEDNEDEIYAGDYIPRRLISETMSIEYLGFYTPKSKDKTFAIVTGIFGLKSQASTIQKKLVKDYPNSFVLESKIFMGCMH